MTKVPVQKMDGSFKFIKVNRISNYLVLKLLNWKSNGKSMEYMRAVEENTPSVMEGLKKIATQRGLVTNG